MANLMTKDRFYGKDGRTDVTTARRVFVEKLIANGLDEPFSSVLGRIDVLLRRLLGGEAEAVTVVSHGFFLKIIEALIREPGIKQNQRRLLHHFDGNTETFRFCEGFRVDVVNGSYQFGAYIRNAVSAD